MTHEAIYNLYPLVKSIKENDDGTFVAYDINGNEVSINMTAVDTKATELQTAEDAKVNQKATDKANGNQKLLDLGLTQAEATALTGYTPPSEE
jgi:hypothetical protein